MSSLRRVALLVRCRRRLPHVQPVLAGGQQAGVGGVVRECVITLACRSPRPLRTPSSTRTAGSRRRSAGRCRWGGESVSSLWRVALLVRCRRRLPHVQPVLAGGQQAGVSGVVRERVITSACRSPRPLPTPSSTHTAGSRRRSAGRCRWGGERVCHHFGVSLSSSAADAVFHTYSWFSQAVSRQVSVGW